jgi:hypothetical protein
MGERRWKHTNIDRDRNTLVDRMLYKTIHSVSNDYVGTIPTGPQSRTIGSSITQSTIPYGNSSSRSDDRRNLSTRNVDAHRLQLWWSTTSSKIIIRVPGNVRKRTYFITQQSRLAQWFHFLNRSLLNKILKYVHDYFSW